MLTPIKKILSLLLIALSVVSCKENYSVKEMNWLSSETVKKGLPLYLNLPDYDNIWKFKKLYPKLICLKLKLKHVNELGVPTKEYNKYLLDFDEEVVNLFDPNTNGISILIETYNGERNYWFYIKDSDFFLKTIEEFKRENSDKELELNYKNDFDWKFIDEYPIELYQAKKSLVKKAKSSLLKH